MAKYIDKSALVAEIEKRQSIVLDPLNNNIHTKRLEETYKSILSFINTLEVKEVDLEYNGKAMLHVLEKGVKQGRREIINRACGWLRKGGSGWYLYSESGEEDIDFVKLAEDFRKAMEE